jgi:serine/threonine protein kinase
MRDIKPENILFDDYIIIANIDSPLNLWEPNYNEEEKSS